jgi:hypothetical protein
MDEGVINDLISAALCGICAWELLRLWQAGSARRPLWRKLAPWVGLVLAVALWSWSVGLEFATVFVPLLTTLFVWLLIFWRQLRLSRESTKATRAKSDKAEKTLFIAKDRRVWAKATAFIAAGPLAGIGSVMLCVALLPVLPFSEPTRLVLMAFLFPTIWAIAAVWACADAKAWRPPIVLMGIGLGSLLTLYI